MNAALDPKAQTQQNIESRLTWTQQHLRRMWSKIFGRRIESSSALFRENFNLLFRIAI